MDLDNYTEKMQGYIDSLEKEKTKILVFQRELPLCLELVSQAIESCKQRLSGTSTTEYNVNGQSSECSEQTTSTEGTTPVLEEFIPMKRAGDDVDEHEDDEEHEHRSYLQQQQQISDDSKKKSDWLRSAQLWNQTPDPIPTQDPQPPRKVVPVVEVKRNNGAFQPFHREKSVPKSSQSSDKSNLPPPVAATSSTAEPATGSGSSGGKRDDKGQNLRKQRRCWSPELHRRFLHALQQLGGSHAATPKQIRELMKVDSLTNDEVKSHLQKFRLHTRRPSPTIQNNSSQQSHIMVVSGIWVPPQEYAAMATTDPTKANSDTRIYAPVASTPQPPVTIPKSEPFKPSQNRRPISESEGRSSHGTGGGARSHSPSTSSSSHTTTASPIY